LRISLHVAVKAGLRLKERKRRRNVAEGERPREFVELISDGLSAKFLETDPLAEELDGRLGEL